MATDVSPDGVYDGFTAMRGFEWTNDYYNHLGVYFSRNVRNAKVDGNCQNADFNGARDIFIWNRQGDPPTLRRLSERSFHADS